MRFNYSLVLIAISMTAQEAMAGMNGYILPQRSNVNKQTVKRINMRAPASTETAPIKEAKIEAAYPKPIESNLDNIGYIEKTRDSTYDMLVKASKLYKSGAMPKEKYIEISLQYVQMQEYFLNANIDKLPATTVVGAMAPVPVAKAYGEVPGAIPVIKTASGNSTLLTCNPGYMTYLMGSSNGGETVCVPVPQVASANTATPGNKSVAPKNGRDCDAGYVLSSAGGPTVCEPLITEISPGTFRCAFTDQVPEADGNGMMKCVNKYVSDNGPQARAPASSEVALTAPVANTRESQIADLYRTMLGRAPDTAGLKFWNDSGESLDSIKTFIKSSDEYKNVND